MSRMQKLRSNLRSNPARPCAPDADRSVARAIGNTAATVPGSSAGRQSTSERRRSLSTLEIEVARLETELALRDAEILRLRARLCNYEGESPSISAVAPQVFAAESATPTQDRQPFAATPAHNREDAYPTLQRVAMMLESCSLLPPPLSTSQPASQRHSPRRSCEIELEFTEDSQFYAGLTQDISQGGVFIATYDLLPVGRRLQLEFDLPDGTHVSANGEVRWLRETASPTSRPGMGVAFLDVAPDSLKAIEEFCKERPPLYMDL